MDRIQRACSVDNVLNAKFKGIQFDGQWYEAIGHPEYGKSWIVYGHSGSGKTTFLMQLMKYLSQFDKVIYNSLEEWPSKGIQDAYRRVGLTNGMPVLMVGESMDDFTKRMKRKRSPRIMIVDSIKYTKFRWEDYQDFCNEFPNHIKIWVGHAMGKEPKGALADDIRYDSSVKIYTEGYRAHITSRYSETGKGTIDIWPEQAKIYYAEINDDNQQSNK